MTPLIDVVFLLLTFFIITFKVTYPEGDFGIKMPLTGAGQPSLSPEAPVEPIQIRLFADPNGNLVDILIGSNHLGPDPSRLREQIIKLVELAQKREDLEATIDYDSHLKYQYTIDAITAVNGHLSGGIMVPLIDKINFVDK